MVVFAAPFSQVSGTPVAVSGEPTQSVTGGSGLRYVLVVAWALVCFNRLEGQAWEDHWCAGGRPAALEAGCEGRSHSDTWVGCIVCSTTSRSSAVRVSRSVCWRSRALNAWIVWAAS